MCDTQLQSNVQPLIREFYLASAYLHVVSYLTVEADSPPRSIVYMLRISSGILGYEDWRTEEHGYMDGRERPQAFQSACVTISARSPEPCAHLKETSHELLGDSVFKS